MGFTLHDCDGNILLQNTADGNCIAFVLMSSSSNTLKKNVACDNGSGGEPSVDAYQDEGTCTGNVFEKNEFCTTSGI